MKRMRPVIFILLLLGFFTLSGVWQQYRRFLQTPLNIASDGRVLPVRKGASIRAVVAELEQLKATHMDWRWRLLGRLQPHTIKAGEYALTGPLLPLDLLRLLASGKVVAYHFTIIEGWTVQQLLDALDEDRVLKHTLNGVRDLQALNSLLPGSGEGWFLPETYSFERGRSDLELLQRAFRAMQKALAAVWAHRAPDLPYKTPYEMLVLASIIEKETALAQERSTIAGVFVRRLRKNWRLETDPSVIYGMGNAYQGNIRRQDLKKDTPYNTYTRRGLPPTPIALPGKASLQAAAHPATGETMFFVANGQGGHTFSNTLEAHNRAVNEMLRQRHKKSQP